MSKKDVVLYSLVVVVLLIASMSYSKISAVEQRLYELDNIRHNVQDINHSMSSISSQVYEQVNEMVQDQIWVQSKGYEIKEVNIDEKLIDVILEWRLRDLQENEEVSFLYREEGDSNWKELNVVQRNGLNFSVEHSFLVNGNYETQIIASSDTGKRSEEFLALNYGDQLESRMNIHAEVYQLNSGHLDFTIDIYNYLDHEFTISKNREDFKIKKAMAYLYIDGVLTEEIDILSENPHFRNEYYEETIFYSETYRVEGREEEQFRNVELKVVVEDGIGYTYEMNAIEF
ncbi:hypothetical protein [Evansella tamaricis]|uniref:Uncharacterized protein n=1 Tax=Evansella tamaricis TaxID=2069301 RepID=A0ABS6JKM0_9BACI|nr:hypothetical protein [Evansella tamaricis]MBU9714229.1 hypothetical protein [Evansella tamaricis]